MAVSEWRVVWNRTATEDLFVADDEAAAVDMWRRKTGNHTAKSVRAALAAGLPAGPVPPVPKGASLTPPAGRLYYITVEYEQAALSPGGREYTVEYEPSGPHTGAARASAAIRVFRTWYSKEVRDLKVVDNKMHMRAAEITPEMATSIRFTGGRLLPLPPPRLRRLYWQNEQRARTYAERQRSAGKNVSASMHLEGPPIQSREDSDDSYLRRALHRRPPPGHGEW